MDVIRASDDIKLAESFLKKIKQEKNPSCYLFGVNKITKIFIDRGEFEKGLNLVNNTRKSYNSKCLDTLLAENYLLTSSLYIKIQNSDSAIYYCIKAEEFSSKLGITSTQIMAIGNMAVLFIDLGQSSKALWYFKKANQLALSIKDYNKVSIISGNIATTYALLFDETKNVTYLDSALITQLESIQNARAVNNTQVLQYGLGTIAGIYTSMHNYKEALMYCDSLFMINDLLDQNRVVYFNEKANIYNKIGKINLAVAYADSTYQLAKFALPPIEKIAALNAVIGIYKSGHKTEKALEIMEELMHFSDSINNIETKERVVNLEQKYNKSQNEKQIFELNKQTEVDKLQIRSLIAFTGIAILIIVIIIFFYRQSLVKNKLKTIETEQRLNRARMDPHFFFNILSSLRSFTLKENNATKTADYLTKYAKIMRQSLESSYTELISLETEIEFLNNYFEIQKLRYPSRFDYVINIENNIETSEIQLPSMIIQPFVENAIEHGFSENAEMGRIILDFSLNNGELKIAISDNGSGTNSTSASQKSYASRATQIVKDRLFLLNKQYRSNARFDINSQQNSGYTVILFLPLIYSK